MRVLAARRLLAGVQRGADRVVLDVSELADAVAERERTAPGARVEVEDRTAHRERVETTLCDRHLPVLDDAGAVTFDADARTVEYRGVPALEAELPLRE